MFLCPVKCVEAVAMHCRGEAAQICPKISNIRLVGTVGVHLRPIVDEIPGFGCLIITLLKPPKINYRVDLGAAMGGQILGGRIAAFVNDLIPQILNGFLVWPERIVSPIVDEKFFGSIEDYMLRHQGVLKVLHHPKPNRPMEWSIVATSGM